MLSPTGPKACYKNAMTKSKYCKTHQYFNEFTETDIQDIKAGIWTTCSRCNRWKNNDGGHCHNCNQKRMADYHEQKVVKNKCHGIDRNGGKCRGDPKNGTDYCNAHQYMVEYNDEQKTNLTQCSTCKMYKYLAGYKTCDGEFCRGKLKKKYEGPTCTITSCQFKPKDNGYCGKHQRIGWKISIEADGTKKVCADWGHSGCSNILNINDKSKCEECLKKDREEDKIRRDIRKAEADKYNSCHTSTKQCNKCGRIKKIVFIL